ncbi:MAG: diguanylate cyclase [Selenomonadaceae bacterium]|nr:diguanylate cyclase [Selenomonadaceae bacterium]
MQKVLIVDDDPVMLRLASIIISKHFQVVTASSGEEALKIFETEKPDLVLSDLLMPEMDGYELHRILQEKNSESVPIVFMTADEDEDSERRGFDIGVDDYIHKPFKADVLLRRIQNVLRNSNKIRGLKQAVDLDALTGLLNKTTSQRKISDLCRKHQGVLMIIDLDSFKMINDLYGHSIGDKILIRFAALIKEIINASDLAGRIGGDTFIVFCQDIQNETTIIEKINSLNEKLSAAVKEIVGKSMNISFGASAGAVFIPSDGTDFSILCSKANKALYEAKQASKHSCSFYGDSDSDQSDRRKLLDMQMIFGERIITNGAYFVEINGFKEIYRMLVRLVKNYRRDVQIMQITLDTENSDALDKFRELLLNCLQQSDCVTQNGKKQFLVLMPETHIEECDDIEQKIISKWRSSSFARFFIPKFEFETIN